MDKVHAVRSGGVHVVRTETIRELVKNPEWDARLLRCMNVAETQNLIDEYIKAKGLRTLDLSKRK